MKILSVILLIVLAYALGMWHGWAVGVKDGQNLYNVTAP
jgi:hypothetical protein